MHTFVEAYNDSDDNVQGGTVAKSGEANQVRTLQSTVPGVNKTLCKIFELNLLLQNI